MGSSTITVDTYFVSNSQTLAVPNQISDLQAQGNNTDSVSVYDAAGTNALVAGGATATFTTLDALSFNEIGSLAAYQQNGTTDTVHKTAHSTLRTSSLETG